MNEHTTENDAPYARGAETLGDVSLVVAERYRLTGRATGAIVPERQRCICPDGLCLDHCRACNYSGRDLEETCIADPDWTPDEDDLARREGRVIPPGNGGAS